MATEINVIIYTEEGRTFRLRNGGPLEGIHPHDIIIEQTDYPVDKQTDWKWLTYIPSRNVKEFIEAIEMLRKEK